MFSEIWWVGRQQSFFSLFTLTFKQLKNLRSPGVHMYAAIYQKASKELYIKYFILVSIILEWQTNFPHHSLSFEIFSSSAMFICSFGPPHLLVYLLFQMLFYSPTMLCYTMLHHWRGSGKYTTVLCIGTGEVDARVPAPFHAWGVEGFWSVLWCAESLQDWDEFFILVQVRLTSSDISA